MMGEAAERLAQEAVCNREGRPQGMITDRDIAIKVVARGQDASATKVSDSPTKAKS